MSSMQMLYGPAIQEAAASGDLNRMKEVCRQAEEYLENTGDISAALQVLKVEIAKLTKDLFPPVIPLYAVTMQGAAASGDLNKMKEVSRQAEEYLANTGDVSAALQVLKIEIAKLEKK